MTLHGVIRAHVLADTAVAATIGTRLYSSVLPEAVVLPAATFQRISTRFLGGHAPSSGAAMRYQFTAWAKTYNEAVALAEAMRLALDGWREPGVGVMASYPANQLDLFDPATQRYYTPLDAFIWATIAVPA